MSKKTYETVDHPPHYNFGEIEVIEVIEAWGWGDGFLRGTVVKHLARAGRKPGAEELQDLEKATWYLARLVANVKKAAKKAKRKKRRR